jgi:hypothetical protein
VATPDEVSDNSLIWLEPVTDVPVIVVAVMFVGVDVR